MRQRVMIAIALACEPQLLIADEPTTALDVTIQAQVLDLIADLRRDSGLAVALITHDLGVVAEQADRVIVMYAGEIVEEGPTAQVIGAPLHPYTAGLLASMPRIDALDRPTRPIPGHAPGPTELPAHCRFMARCGFADAQCAGPVALADCGAGRKARCVRPGVAA
jgi:oligopeptide/dipeptide ABC transporter ATP-binding protein